MIPAEVQAVARRGCPARSATDAHTILKASPPPQFRIGKRTAGGTDREAEIDLSPEDGPRLDPPNPLQLETGGAIPQSRLSLPESVPAASQSEFWAKQTAHKFSIAAKLREVGLVDIAAKLEACHSTYTVAVCNSCGSVAKFPNRCDLGYCPECQPRLARERKESVGWWAREIPQPKHVVLTVRNLPTLTAGHVAEFKRWLTRLRRRKFCRNWLGGFYSIEVTNESRGWHLHAHLLVNAKWIDAPGLAREWNNVTNGLGRIVKVKDCRQRDYLAEVTKYAVKGSQLAAWSPADIAVFIAAFEHQRTFAVFGSLYGKRTEFSEWLKSIRDAKPRCSCGSCSVRYYSETDWLLMELKSAPSARPRPPRPDPQLALSIYVPANYVAS